RLPILAGVSENAYGIYMFNSVFVLWTKYLLLGVSFPAIAKGSIVFAVSLVLSWAASAALRRVPVAGRVIGAAGAGVRSQKSENRNSEGRHPASDFQRSEVGVRKINVMDSDF